jgi:hypothetical protein
MKIINKHPRYIKNSDRIKRINQAYILVFRAINKLEPDTFSIVQQNCR